MKKIVKKIWLPTVTALMIVLGVIMLVGAISCTQTLQSGETVMQHTEDASAVSHAETNDEGAVVSHEAAEPSNAESHAAETTTETHQKRPIPALPHEFTVTGIGYKPNADELSYEQAAAIAVDMWKKVFGDKFNPETSELFVVNTDSCIHRSYEVCIGSQFFDGASYICIVDTVTGQTNWVRKQTPYKQENLEDDPNSANDDLMNTAMTDPKYEEITKAFINEKFANGRSIVEVQRNAIAWDFEQPDVDMIVDYSVKMSEGECYQVFIAYPSYEVVEVEFFPLGWISCYYGYFYEDAAADYPDHEVKGQLPDMSE